MIDAYVTGLGLWAPGFPRVEAWRLGSRDPRATAPPCELLSSRAKRGTSLVTRMAVEAATQAAAQAGASLSAVGTVFGSALGEVQTAVDQMAMIAREDGLLSPTRFKNSVHNTAAGLLSIASGNRGFSTALAAGPATFAMSLLEGMTFLDSAGGTVVVSVADEPVPPPFDTGHRYDALALAICLSDGPVHGRFLAVLGEPGRRRLRTSATPTGSANPAAAGLPLFAAILDGRTGAVALEPGLDEPFCVELGSDRESS